MMSECLPKDRVVICLENVNDDYRITTEEISSHAKKLGVDFENERHLLPIVLRGLIHPLPSGWIPCYDKQLEEFFYYNIKSAKSQWQHPIDEYYKELITKIRNEYDGNISEYLNSEESSKMLPLRQNKKPQLLPIKQLLKYKDEDKVSIDGNKVFKSDLQSSMKSKNDSPSYKKSVSFSTNKMKSFPEKESQFFNEEYDKHFEESEKMLKKKGIWNSALFDVDRGSEDFRHLYDRNSSNSDDDSKADRISPENRNPSKRKNSLTKVPSSVTVKQPSNQNKSSNNEMQLKNNFKRLQINLRHPDSFLLSDTNRDDFTKNILSESASSEICTEDETPHNILTNITESGIDVNTVTDLQKLKAKNMMNSQSHSHDLSKRGISQFDASFHEALANLERDLNSKYEIKINEEMEKLKKFYRDSREYHFNNSTTTLEKQNNFEVTLIEIRDKLQSFKQEISTKVEKVNETFNEFKSICNAEIGKLKENLTKCLDANTKHECSKNLESVRKQLNTSIEDRLSSIEQNLMKKLEILEANHKKEMENFRMEKEKLLSEHHEKFQSFKDEYRKNVEKTCQENSTNIIQSGFNELFVNRVKKDDPLWETMEKIVTTVLNEEKKNQSVSIRKKTVATQTENTQDKEEIVDMEAKITEISNAVQLLTKEIHDFKRSGNKEAVITPKLPFREFVSPKNKKILDNQIHTLPFTALKVQPYRTDFSPFEEFSCDIDIELERYRKKYLSNTKWLTSK